MKLHKLILILSLATLPLATSARSIDETAPTPGHWNYEGSLTIMNIDGEQAAQEDIKDRATAVGFYANYFNQNWVTTLRGSFIIYSDLNGFSETVEVTGGFNDGDIKTASSDANAYSLGVATGRQWRFGEQRDTSAVLQVGYDHILASERAIANCSNCPSQDIEVDGGVFVQGAIKHNFGSVSAGLMVAQYLTGDGLANQIGITIGSRF